MGFTLAMLSWATPLHGNWREKKEIEIVTINTHTRVQIESAVAEVGRKDECQLIT